MGLRDYDLEKGDDNRHQDYDFVTVRISASNSFITRWKCGPTAKINDFTRTSKCFELEETRNFEVEGV